MKSLATLLIVVAVLSELANARRVAPTGTGSATTTVEDASQPTALDVRDRPICIHKDLVAVRLRDAKTREELDIIKPDVEKEIADAEAKIASVRQENDAIVAREAAIEARIAQKKADYDEKRAADLANQKRIEEAKARICAAIDEDDEEDPCKGEDFCVIGQSCVALDDLKRRLAAHLAEADAQFSVENVRNLSCDEIQTKLAGLGQDGKEKIEDDVEVKDGQDEETQQEIEQKEREEALAYCGACLVSSQGQCGDCAKRCIDRVEAPALKERLQLLCRSELDTRDGADDEDGADDGKETIPTKDGADDGKETIPTRDGADDGKETIPTKRAVKQADDDEARKREFFANQEAFEKRELEASDRQARIAEYKEKFCADMNKREDRVKVTVVAEAKDSAAEKEAEAQLELSDSCRTCLKDATQTDECMACRKEWAAKAAEDVDTKVTVVPTVRVVKDAVKEVVENRLSEKCAILNDVDGVRITDEHKADLKEACEKRDLVLLQKEAAEAELDAAAAEKSAEESRKVLNAKLVAIKEAQKAELEAAKAKAAALLEREDFKECAAIAEKCKAKHAAGELTKEDAERCEAATRKCRAIKVEQLKDEKVVDKAVCVRRERRTVYFKIRNAIACALVDEDEKTAAGIIERAVNWFCEKAEKPAACEGVAKERLTDFAVKVEERLDGIEDTAGLCRKHLKVRVQFPEPSDKNLVSRDGDKRTEVDLQKALADALAESGEDVEDITIVDEAVEADVPEDTTLYFDEATAEGAFDEVQAVSEEEKEEENTGAEVGDSGVALTVSFGVAAALIAAFF